MIPAIVIPDTLVLLRIELLLGILTTVLFFVWAAAFLVALWSLHQARRFANRIPVHAIRELDDVFPRVAVILPIKGVDEDTPGNIQALLNQDYPNYRLIFSVESADDPAVKLIERLAASHPPGKISVVVAGLAENRGQKVHNQLAAVEQTTDEDEILAFMDADANPGPRWIHALVVPLTRGDGIGCTTGYRYYVPATRHLANSAVSVINAGVAALLGPTRRTFAWGGSMAMRRRDFFADGIHSAWQNAVSDDYVVSHVIKKVVRKKIHFVSRCMVPSVASFTWSSFFEFAVRQYRITRVCVPLVWLAALVNPLLFLTAYLYTFLRTIQSSVISIGGEWPFEPLIAGAMFIALYSVTVARGFYILQGARQMFPKEWPAIWTTTYWMTFGYPCVAAVNLVALIASAFGRTIDWRGISYKMLSRTRTQVIRPIRIDATPATREPELARS